MEPNPYKFSSNNTRIVEDAQRSPKVVYGAAFIFVASLHVYNRRFFRKDGNLLNFFAFTAASLPASYTYGSFLFSSPETEAAILNNEREKSH